MQVTEPLNECSIGARLPDHETGLDLMLGAFTGQMGCIYLFEDILSPGLCSMELGAKLPKQHKH